MKHPIRWVFDQGGGDEACNNILPLAQIFASRRHQNRLLQTPQLTAPDVLTELRILRSSYGLQIHIGA